jgi:hypothetical protein
MAFQGPLTANEGRRTDDDPRERARQDHRGWRQIGSASSQSYAWTGQTGLRACKLLTNAQSDSERKAELFLCTMDPFARAILIHDMSQESTKSGALKPSTTAILGSGGLFAG